MPQKGKPVANFSIDYYQFLDEQGNLSVNSNDQLVTNEQCLQLYKDMVLTRVFDNKAIALQRTGRIGTYPSSKGQEAIAVAIGHALDKNDVFCPYYREHGAQIIRGVKMEEILLFWGGDERGSQYENCQQDLPVCVPIASQCLHAVGIATAIKLRKQNRAVIVCIGDGGTSQGDFYEAINVAGIWNLPIVFVVNNNQWAISVPRSKQTKAETIAQKGIAGGLTSLQVDGNDVIALSYVLKQSLEKAKNHMQPTLIEAITYRLCDHTTADDATRYRPQKELQKFANQEPLIRTKKYLENLQYWDEEKESALLNEVQEKVNLAVTNYEAVTPQKVTSIFDSLYAELPDAYLEQREELKKYAGDKINHD